MEPEISDGNIVIVDRDLPGEDGDIVLCLIGNELVIGRVETEGGECFLRNNDEKVRLGDCQASAVVIEVIKRLK